MPTWKDVPLSFGRCRQVAYDEISPHETADSLFFEDLCDANIIVESHIL